jgi:hypothetical protein
MILVLVLWAGTGYACKCTEHNLADDIAYSDMVFIGKMVDRHLSASPRHLGTVYEFEITKVYKGKISPATRYAIYQDGSSCTRRGFLKDKTYLVFSKDSAVSQCNLSARVENNPNVAKLDSIYKHTSRAAKGADEDVKLLTNQYNNNVLLSDHSNGKGTTTNLAIGGKKVVFTDGRKIWLGKNKVFESESESYPTSYYLLADSKESKWLKETGADYYIFVTNEHQGLNLKPGFMNDKKPKSRICKTIKAITSI